MDIIDIPNQLSRAFKYAGRTRRGFILSLLVAILVTGVVFDLLYGFFYTRIYNAEQVQYGPFYWMVLVILSLFLPLFAGIVTLIRWRLQQQPFKPDYFGIAIAPFETTSINVTTLTASSGLSALDEVMNQFFEAIRSLVNNEEWASSFDFRILPPTVHVKNKAEAQNLYNALQATLVIWGEIIQDDKLFMVLQLTGLDTDLRITGTANPFFISQALQYFTLSATAYTLFKKDGNYREAERFQMLAIKHAAEIDASVADKSKGLMLNATTFLEEIRTRMKSTATL